MRLHRPVGLPLLIVALGPGLAFGGDSAAEATLKAKDLTKSGRAYVIEAEKPVLAKMKDLKATYTAYAQLAQKQEAFEHYEAQSAQLEENRVTLKTHLDELNQRIIEQATSQGGGGGPGGGGGGQGGGGRGGPGGGQGSPLVLERDQVKATLAEVTLGQKALKSEAPVVRDKAALGEEVKKKGESFRTALAELRSMVDQVTAKYDELGAQPAIKKALEDLRTAAKAKVNLGPSDAFLAGVKELDQAERRFLGKKSVAANASTKKKAKSKR